MNAVDSEHLVKLPLTSVHLQELCAAIEYLETQNFAARLADYAGQPVNVLIKYMPRTVNRGL